VAPLGWSSFWKPWLSSSTQGSKNLSPALIRGVLKENEFKLAGVGPFAERTTVILQIKYPLYRLAGIMEGESFL